MSKKKAAKRAENAAMEKIWQRVERSWREEKQEGYRKQQKGERVTLRRESAQGK